MSRKDIFYTEKLILIILIFLYYRTKTNLIALLTHHKTYFICTNTHQNHLNNITNSGLVGIIPYVTRLDVKIFQLVVRVGDNQPSSNFSPVPPYNIFFVPGVSPRRSCCKAPWYCIPCHRTGLGGCVRP